MTLKTVDTKPHKAKNLVKKIAIFDAFSPYTLMVCHSKGKLLALTGKNY
jgi:hypothetical protein